MPSPALAETPALGVEVDTAKAERITDLGRAVINRVHTPRASDEEALRVGDAAVRLYLLSVNNNGLDEPDEKEAKRRATERFVNGKTLPEDEDVMVVVGNIANLTFIKTPQTKRPKTTAGFVALLDTAAKAELARAGAEREGLIVAIDELLLLMRPAVGLAEQEANIEEPASTAATVAGEASNNIL